MINHHLLIKHVYVILDQWSIILLLSNYKNNPTLYPIIGILYQLSYFSSFIFSTSESQTHIVSLLIVEGKCNVSPTITILYCETDITNQIITCSDKNDLYTP